MTQQQDLAKELTTLAEAAPSVDDLMTMIVGRLQQRLPHYNWVGFYKIEKGDVAEGPMLVLGPYVGAVTPHTRIPLNQGICGAAATSGHTVVVDDVNSDPRYLACSIETKSEIVVPIRVRGRNRRRTGHRQPYSRGLYAGRSATGRALCAAGRTLPGEDDVTAELRCASPERILWSSKSWQR